VAAHQWELISLIYMRHATCTVIAQLHNQQPAAALRTKRELQIRRVLDTKIALLALLAFFSFLQPRADR
jgi:hypothetical protein